jgi:hypothetical protein
MEDIVTKPGMIAVFALLGLSACSTGAAMVRKDAGGGRVELHGAYMPAMGEARELMVDHCYGRYDMVEVRDAVEFRCRHAHGAAPDSKLVASSDVPGQGSL